MGAEDHGQAETTPSSQSVEPELEVQWTRKGLQRRARSNWEAEGKTKGGRRPGNQEERVEEGGGHTPGVSGAGGVG